MENHYATAREHDPHSFVPPLAQASESALAIHSASWKDGIRSAQMWRNSLHDYLLPVLGRRRVDRITTAGIMAVLLPYWATKHETMRRIKQRVSRIFSWAVAEGHRTNDSAGATLDAALPRKGRSTRNFAALPRGEVGWQDMEQEATDEALGGQEEAGPAGDPAIALRSEAAAGDAAVDVGVAAELAVRGGEDCEEADPGAKMQLIGPDKDRSRLFGACPPHRPETPVRAFTIHAS